MHCNHILLLSLLVFAACEENNSNQTQLQQSSENLDENNKIEVKVREGSAYPPVSSTGLASQAKENQNHETGTNPTQQSKTTKIEQIELNEEGEDLGRSLEIRDVELIVPNSNTTENKNKESELRLAKCSESPKKEDSINQFENNKEGESLRESSAYPPVSSTGLALQAKENQNQGIVTNPSEIPKPAKEKTEYKTQENQIKANLGGAMSTLLSPIIFNSHTIYNTSINSTNTTIQEISKEETEKKFNEQEEHINDTPTLENTYPLIINNQKVNYKNYEELISKYPNSDLYLDRIKLSNERWLDLAKGFNIEEQTVVCHLVTVPKNDHLRLNFIKQYSDYEILDKQYTNPYLIKTKSLKTGFKAYFLYDDENNNFQKVFDYSEAKNEQESKLFLGSGLYGIVNKRRGNQNIAVKYSRPELGYILMRGIIQSNKLYFYILKNKLTAYCNVSIITKVNDSNNKFKTLATTLTTSRTIRDELLTNDPNNTLTNYDKEAFKTFKENILKMINDGWMHYDFGVHNIVVDVNKKTFTLIDFDRARFYADPEAIKRNVDIIKDLFNNIEDCIDKLKNSSAKFTMYWKGFWILDN